MALHNKVVYGPHKHVHPQTEIETNHLKKIKHSFHCYLRNWVTVLVYITLFCWNMNTDENHSRLLTAIAKKVELNRMKTIGSPLLRGRWRSFNASVDNTSPELPKKARKLSDKRKKLSDVSKQKSVPAHFEGIEPEQQTVIPGITRSWSDFGISDKCDTNRVLPRSNGVISVVIRHILDDDIKKLKKLLKAKELELNVVDGRGIGPIHEASYTNNLKCLKILLKFGANVNFVDSEGWTALHACVAGENLECMKFLINNKADVNYLNKKGWAPLHLAVCQRNLCLVHYLTKAGARVLIRDDEDGVSPFQLAINLHCGDIVMYFTHLPELLVQR